MSLALVVILSFTNCGDVDEEVGLPSTQKMVDAVLESLDDITTFQFDMDMTVDMSGETEGEAFEMTMAMDSGAEVDVENREMGMTLNMDMAVPDEGEMKIGMEYYLIKDVLYMSTEGLEIDPMWMKLTMPEGTWEEMSQAGSQIELLKTAQVKVIGSEKVRGMDCYVFELTPDMEQLWQIAMQQSAVGGAEMLPDVPEEFFQEMFRSFSIKQWIAKDTYYLTKAKMDMAIELTAEAMEVEEGGMSMDIAQTLFIYDYNEPISVVLPPEAEEAIEVPME
jgi:hypothetical protein